MLIAEEFLDGSPSALILGDNIFHGETLGSHLLSATRQQTGATVFGYRVHDPDRYGVVSFDANGVAIDIEEKPANPKSNIAVTGLYFYDEKAPALAATIKPSPRGELEITDLNRLYLEAGKLQVETLGRGFAWLDTGTHGSLLEASMFIETVEKRQGLKVACPEEIAFRMRFIDAGQITELAKPLLKNEYGKYLMMMLDEDNPFIEHPDRPQSL